MSQQAIPYLFQTISRQSVPDAPIYDPGFNGVTLNGKQLTGAIKTWVDPNPPLNEDPVNYRVFNADYSIGTLTVSARVAKLPNLPGHPDFPHYAPEPSGATLNGAPFPVVSIEDANALATELGLTPEAVSDPMAQFGPPFSPVYPTNDPRRAYSLKMANGVSVPVSVLLAAKNANGVGAPGHWDQTGPSPVWVADLPSPAPDAQILPVPLGDFPAGATVLQPSIVNGNAVLEIPDAPSNSTPATGGFADADRAMLTNLYNGLKKVYGALIP